MLTRSFSLIILLCLLWCKQGLAQEAHDLRVCADPNNLPFSHKNQQGFENKVAELIAQDMGRKLSYVWFPQRMGFIRNTLKKWSDRDSRFACDLVIGVPTEFDQASTTAPYYRSTYAVLVGQNPLLNGVNSQADIEALPLHIKSQLKIAAFSPSPAVSWLQQYQMSHFTRYFRIMNGDPDDFPGKLVKRVANGEFDILIIWGPIGGYFNKDASLTLIPMKSADNHRFDFPVSMAVRYGEKAWKEQVEASLHRVKPEITKLLANYRFPLVEGKYIPKDDDD